MLGLIGKKIGMTQLFGDDGSVVPVTAIEAGPCPIVQIRTAERDGYQALQLGFGRKREKRSTRPAVGHSAGAGLDYVPAMTREFRLGPADVLAEDPHTPAAATQPTAAEGGSESEEAAAPEAGAPQELRVGHSLTVDIFAEGERVKVTGYTKGRGFQGVVKRHGFAGFPNSHGSSEQRVPGSAGPGTNPSRVIKGRRMGGRMGNKRKTIRNLTVVRVDPERNLIFVKGAVPGARNGWVFVTKQ
jgi:large subunit ribosomal protein L3